MTRTLVIGAGSIGLRHATVLASLGHDVALVTRRTDLELPTYSDVGGALAAVEPAYVVVAVETALHEPTVVSLRDAGYRGTLLIEKPLAVDTDLSQFDTVGVGFNLRFHPVIVALREELTSVAVHTVEVYVGQHLSTWRPGRETADQYSAHAERGGGALRDLSHEFDYLASLLGSCRGVFARGGRLGDVTVDSDDAWGIVAEYERAPVVTIQLNYLDTVGRRRILANTSGGTVEADLVAGTLTSGGSVRHFGVGRDVSYRAMHAAMLEGAAGIATVDESRATDDVIRMVESSANEKAWVPR